MALKKEIAGSTKYYYAAISYIGLTKYTTKKLGYSTPVQVDLLVKDTSNEDYEQLETSFKYNIPLEHYKEETVVLKRFLFDEDGIRLYDEDGVRLYEEYEDGTRLVLDESYVHPLTIESMSNVDNNPYKIIYEWLKENIALYDDFEDC